MIRKGVIIVMKKFVPIIKKGETCKVFLDSIMLIEQDLRKTFIYTEDDTYWVYAKVDEFAQYLDENFLRCHHSCIINLNKVVKMKEQTVFFENGFKLTMGRDKFQCARQHFARYMLLSAGRTKTAEAGN